MRSARAGPSTQVGWRQVKVSSTFSKAATVPVGTLPSGRPGGRRDQTQDLPGLQGAACLPILQKKGDGCPPLGVPPRPGFFLWKGQARCHRARSRGYLLRSVRPVRCTFSPAAPVLRSKLLKKFHQKLYAPSASLPSALCMPFHAARRILHHHMAGGQFVPDGVSGSPVLAFGLPPAFG